MEDQFIFEPDTDIQEIGSSTGGAGGAGKVKFDRLTIKKYGSDESTASDMIVPEEEVHTEISPADYDVFF